MKVIFQIWSYHKLSKGIVMQESQFAKGRGYAQSRCNDDNAKAFFEKAEC